MQQTYYQTNMDYEQFFPKSEPVCDCSNHIRGTVFLLGLISLVADCIAQCKRRKDIQKLKTENETLKSIIFRSVDRALVKMMKNGNENENDEEE